jgi:hypothetical protein
MGGAPDVPQQNLGQELGQILQYMPKFAQKSYALARDYASKWAGKDIGLSKEFAPQYAGLGYDITKQFAPQYLGLNLGQMQQAIGGMPLLSELNKQAQAGLASQGMPTEDELRRASQQTLAGFAARGQTMGNQSLAADVLSRDELVHQRAREAQQFAAGVQGLDLSQLQGLGGVAQMPNLAAYAAPGAGFGPMQAGMGAVQGVSGQLFPFASNIFDANQSAAAQQNIAASNKSGGLTGAGIGAIGSLGAAAIGL